MVRSSNPRALCLFKTSPLSRRQLLPKLGFSPPSLFQTQAESEATLDTELFCLKVCFVFFKSTTTTITTKLLSFKCKELLLSSSNNFYKNSPNPFWTHSSHSLMVSNQATLPGSPAPFFQVHSARLQRETGSLVEAGHTQRWQHRGCLTRREALRGSSWFCPQHWKLYCGLGAVYIKI